MHSTQSPSADPPDPPLIGYAPPRHPILSFVRRHLRLTLLLLVVASAVRWVPFVWHRGQVLYWQEQCAEHVAPPGTVIAATDVGPPYPPPLVAGQWSSFYSLLSPPGLSSDGTLFLHRLQRPSGEPVLVAVDLDSPDGCVGISLAQIRVFRIGRAARLPQQLQDSVVFLTADEKYRFYAGQTDPADPTHFTVSYQADANNYVIDGWVREASVVLEHRKPPIQRPPASATKSP